MPEAIATQIKVPDTMNTLGSMLNVANSAQQLKGQQITLGERQKLQGVLSDMSKYDNNGTPDYNRLINDVMSVAPTTGAEYLTKIIQTHQASNEAQKSLLSLNNDQRQQTGQFILSLADQTPEVAGKTLAAFAQQNPNLAPMANFAWNYQLGPNAGDPEAFKKAVYKVAQGTMKVPDQVTATTGNYVNTGGTLQQTSPMAAAAGAPSQIANTLPPTTQTVDPRTGAPTYVGPAPGGKPVAAGLAPGQAQNLADLQKEVLNVRQSGDQVPAQRNINQNILRLSRDTTTGPGTALWQKGLATVGLGQFGDNYQELGKFLVKNSIQNMMAMGGTGTAQHLQAAEAANGSTEFNPGALQAITKYNDASVSAIDKYRQGIDLAVGLENPNFGNAARFKSDWAKNLDIDVFRVENAMRDGDTMELQRISHELGPDKMKQLAQKRKNLESLATTGKLP